ncbi:MAG: hypothetical protein ICV55_06850 [Coleofasciculus sp. C3-bin4]|nr:hypothetical protein [Coleofasciculus sp. C3-bin4]
MKCIQCGTDNKLRDRTGNQGRCTNCNHPFAFEPTSMGKLKMTDPFFAKAIADISANNTLYFTPKQLLYLLDKRQKRSGLVNSLFSILLGMLSIYLGTRTIKSQAEISQSFLFPQNQFQEWLNRWNQVNGQIPKMLPSPREESTPALVSPEVSAYSFDRLVVCDSAAIAQLLIANNFHFENNCAVLSITGYPQSIFSTVMDMLRRNPDLKVYALHDATPRGVGLLHRLRSSSSWFENSNVAIFDLGLLPRQLFSSRKVFVQSSDASAQAAKQLPAPVREQLSTEELEWLESGKFVELESFTPQKLIQVVTQGIAGSRNLDLESEDSSLILVDDTGSVYASDSFG